MKDIDAKTKKKKLASLMKSMQSLAKSTKDDNIVQILGQKPMDDTERIPTGYLTLDVATGGGIKRGRVVELFGAESSGKSLIAQKIIAACQEHGGLCAYVDMEQTFDVTFAKKLGVNTDELAVSQPSSMQQAFEVVDALVDAGVDVIVLDSIAALVPEEELEADVGKQTIGLVARYMSQFLKRINVKLAKSGGILLCINQTRQKIGVMYGDPTTTAGGNALKFYSSIRMRVSKSAEGMIKEKGSDEPIGQGIRVKVVKNKTAPPFRTAEFKVFFDGRKVSETDQIADIALAHGLIPRYNAAGELCETGRQYRWNSEPNFLAKSKAEVPEQLDKFPKVREELKQIIMSGEIENNTVASEDMDSDMSDEDFENQIKEDAENISEINEAEEEETSFDDM